MSEPGGGPVVELRHVSKWYGDVVAVADLSFSLGPGVTGLRGPNGAGKTTTLKAVTGLLHPSQGEVLLFGRPIAGDPMLYRAIGVVPDGDRLYPRLTVRSYARLHAELHGLEQPAEAADQAGFTGPGYLVAMAAVAAVAGAILTWRVLRLRA